MYNNLHDTLAKTVALVPELLPRELRNSVSRLVSEHRNFAQLERTLIETDAAIRAHALCTLRKIPCVALPACALEILPDVQQNITTSLHAIDRVRHEIFSLLDNTRLSTTLGSELNYANLSSLVIEQAERAFQKADYPQEFSDWIQISSGECLRLLATTRCRLDFLDDLYKRDMEAFRAGGLTGAILDTVLRGDLARIDHVHLVRDVHLPRLESTLTRLCSAVSAEA